MYIFIFFTCSGSPQGILRVFWGHQSPSAALPPGSIQGRVAGRDPGAVNCGELTGKASQECRIKQPKSYPWLRQVTGGTQKQGSLISE